MRLLYLDCSMGAAGDMLSAALLDIVDYPEDVLDKLNAIGIPYTNTIYNRKQKCGIDCAHVNVVIDCVSEGSHSEYHEHGITLSEVYSIIEKAHIPDKVISDAKNVYNIIAKAESQVHGTTVDKVHFHEVGMLDAVADIVNVCYLINELNPDRIISSPINTGYGFVKCAHGTLPVPAPATEMILRGIPSYSDDIKCELCTPTGAALIKYYADDYGPRPVMNICRTGYGAGNKDFDRLNAVRAFLGESENSSDEIAELSCNIDDMTAEDLAFAVEELMNNGALDAFITPIVMKKGRAAHMLTCLCRKEQTKKFAQLIFRHTTTIGIRKEICFRYVLNREEGTADTSLGKVRYKHSFGYGTDRIKYEYDDISNIARDKNMLLDDVRKIIRNEVK